jgi:hypothetical protein
MLLAAAVTALAATAGATSSTARSGLYGSVRLNPAIPVCTVATPCSKPLPDFPLVFSREGRRVARVRTDGRGHYRVALPVGVYTVATTRPRGIGRGLEPTRVRVAAARYRRVDFDYDSGIR